MLKQTTILWCYHVWVEPSGVKRETYKYRVEFTGKSYLSTTWTGEDEKDGFSDLSHRRISVDSIGQIRSFNNDTLISAAAYYLDGQKEDIELKVDDVITKKLQSMYDDITTMSNYWHWDGLR